MWRMRLQTCNMKPDQNNATRRRSSLFAGLPELSEPSAWWWALRTEPGGDALLRDLLRQTLLALHTLQSRNITHRRAPDRSAALAKHLWWCTNLAVGCSCSGMCSQLRVAPT